MSTVFTRGHPRHGLIAFSFFALVALFLTPTRLSASTTVVNGTANQLIEGATGSGGYNGGFVGTNTYHFATEFVFQLPPLPYPQRVIDAAFSFTFSKINPFYNVDLYALPARTSSAPQLGDYFAGAFGTAPNAFALQNDVLTPTSPNGKPSFTPVDLAWYINTQYDRGLQPSSTFFFLRLSPDWTTDPGYPFTYYSASSATLTLTTAVPEPSSPILLTGVFVAILAHRRPPLRRLALAVLCAVPLLALPTAPVIASTTTINGVPDQLSTQGASVQSQSVMVGVSTFGASLAGEFSFQLPPLPYPQRVVAATITFKASTSSYGPAVTFNTDLYALPARTSPTPLASDFYTGSYTTATAAFALQDNVFTPSLGYTPTTVTVSPVDLAWYVNGQYDRGLQPSSTYLFLRLSPDYTTLPLHGLNGYFVGPATLTLTTAVPFPEPTTAGLATTAIALSALHRRPRPIPTRARPGPADTRRGDA